MLSFLHGFVYDSYMGGAVLPVTREANNMKTTKVITPVGEFTRKTNSRYTHVVVRQSKRARAVYENFLVTGKRSVLSTENLWIKNRGFALTYHSSQQSAWNAAKQKYDWDSSATVVGIYEVAA